jgi:hypothetical protein
MKIKVITAIAATLMAAGASLGTARADQTSFDSALGLSSSGFYFSTLTTAADFAGALAGYIQGSSSGGFFDAYTAFGTQGDTVIGSPSGWLVTLILTATPNTNGLSGSVDIDLPYHTTWSYQGTPYQNAVSPDSNASYNTEFTVSGYTTPVPGPIAGAGFPALLMLAGLMAWRRKSAEML